MISYNNLSISEVNTREGEYNHKKKKHVKFAKPKITTKQVFLQEWTSLEELAAEVRQAVIRNPYDVIEVKFTATMEY